MLNLRSPRERTKRARRFGRSARSIAALITTSLIAPAAIAGVAGVATVATTIAASPASAAAPRVYVVAGDDPSRTGAGSGAWGFHGADYQQLRDIITNPAFFGPNGTVNAQFKIGSPISVITDQSLAGVDVYFSGAVQGVVGQAYSADEQAALKAFVLRGGVLILNPNSPTWNTAELFSVTEQSPEAIFEAGSDHPGVADGFEAPNAGGGSGAGIAVASTPLVTGPFGTVTSYSMWHTVAGFTALPGTAVVNARITTLSCSPQAITCKNPPDAPSGTTTTSSTTSAPPTTTTIDPNPRPNYNNNINNLPSLATVAPGNTITGNGAIIFTSDVDTYSNHSQYNGGVMAASNEVLAKNTFAWIAGVLNAQNPAEGYTPVTPTRWVDTRATGKIGPGGKLNVTIAGTSNGGVTIPADATGVVMNVTATQADGVESFITVYPTATGTNAPPGSSNLNFRAGVDIPNSVMVKLGDSGRITVYNDVGNVNVLIDVVGYFRATSGDRLNSTPPSRVLDTRNAIGSTRTPIGEGESRSVQITGAGGVPAGASAVVLNITASEGTRGGYLSVYPGNLTAVPNTSNLNFLPGQTIANLAIVPLAPDGTIKVFNAFGTTAVLADVLGYFSSKGGSFAQLTPSRLLDTRTGVGLSGVARLGTDTSLEFTVLGRGGVPSEGVRTVVLNVTAAAPTATSWLTVYPDTVPNASNLNFVNTQTIPNLVVAQVNSQGKVKIYNNLGTTDVLADVVAWFN
jgi:hypothetical protein